MSFGLHILDDLRILCEAFMLLHYSSSVRCPMPPTFMRNGRFLVSLVLRLLQDCDLGCLRDAGKDRKLRTRTAQAFGTRSWANAALSQWILLRPVPHRDRWREREKERSISQKL